MHLLIEMASGRSLKLHGEDSWTLDDYKNYASKMHSWKGWHELGGAWEKDVEWAALNMDLVEQIKVIK